MIEGAHAGGVRSLAFASDYLFSGGATDGAVKVRASLGLEVVTHACHPSLAFTTLSFW